MPESQPETSLSDYDKEWDLTEAPVNQGAATEDDRQTDDEDPAPSESAPESTEAELPLTRKGPLRRGLLLVPMGRTLPTFRKHCDVLRLRPCRCKAS